MSNIFGVSPAPWLIWTIVILAVLAIIFGRIFFNQLFNSLLYLLTKQIGRIILGTLLLLGGLIFAVTSHTVPYQHLTHETATLLHVAPHNQADGDVYLQDYSNPTIFYIIHEADFSPPVHAYIFQLNGGYTSLTYDPSQETQIGLTDGIDSSSSISVGTGYTVEQFALVDYLGQSEYAYTSATYRDHPEGIYQNRWLIGGSIAGVGMLLLLFTLWLPHLKQRQAKTAPYAAASAMPPPYTSIPMPGNASSWEYPPAATPQNPYAHSYVQPPEASEEKSYKGPPMP